MTVAVFLAVLAPLSASAFGACPLGRFLADRLRPAVVTFLLTSASVVLAAVSCFATALLVVLGLARRDPVAERLHWSLAGVIRPAGALSAFATVLAVVAAVVLAVSALRVLRTAIALAARYRDARALVGRARSRGAVLEADRVVGAARALPVGGGRVVVDAARWNQLNASDRHAILAHERSHLRHRHDVHLALGALAAAASPLLVPFVRELGYAVERWADEDAAAELEDRDGVARTVATVALADAGREVPRLAVTGGVVPRRVSALLGAPVARAAPLGLAAVVALVVVVLAALGLAAHAWVDLLEILAPA